MKKIQYAIITIILLINICIHTHAQDLVVEGNATITKMDTVNTGTSNVVRQADGTLAVRHYKIGDFAHGGIVFWVDETGEHGLVCTKIDISIGIRWYAGTSGVTRALGTGPLSGEMNTNLIIAGQIAIGDDGANYAALACSGHSVTEGGFNYGDWYLPSREELILILSNIDIIEATAIANGGASFGRVQYWSSNEQSSTEAIAINFQSGTQNIANKSFTLPRVRAVRAF